MLTFVIPRKTLTCLIITCHTDSSRKHCNWIRTRLKQWIEFINFSLNLSIMPLRIWLHTYTDINGVNLISLLVQIIQKHLLRKNQKGDEILCAFVTPFPLQLW